MRILRLLKKCDDSRQGKRKLRNLEKLIKKGWNIDLLGDGSDSTYVDISLEKENNARSKK